MSHIVHWFAYSDAPTRAGRADDALVNTESSVFSGITLTKFFGILVLAFSKSQIFEVSFFLFNYTGQQKLTFGLLLRKTLVF